MSTILIAIRKTETGQTNRIYLSHHWYDDLSLRWRLGQLYQNQEGASARTVNLNITVPEFYDIIRQEIWAGVSHLTVRDPIKFMSDLADALAFDRTIDVYRRRPDLEDDEAMPNWLSSDFKILLDALWVSIGGDA
jgi:hypothetical protein